MDINNLINKITHADCLDILKKLPDKCVDLVITDPPYLIENHGGTKSPLAQRVAKVRDSIDEMAKDFNFEDITNELMRICKVINIIMFCSKAQVSRTMLFFESLNLSVNLCVWDKTNPPPPWKYETYKQS